MPASRRARILIWTATIATVVLAAAIAAAFACNRALSAIVRDRTIRALKETFGSDLEMKSLSVVVFPHFHMAGEGLVLHYRGRTDLPPLISIRSVSAHTGLLALLAGHINQVRLEGLEVQVPPKSERGRQPLTSGAAHPPRFVIDELISEQAVLKTLPNDPDKDPLVWEIHHLVLHDAGSSSATPFRARLVNAKPPGEIETSGKFGPWRTEEPRATPVEGSYTFQKADLSSLKGISGTLSSQGTYQGVLERIQVHGTTDTPDFALDVSGNRFHLTTEFDAVVDGTDGNTLLQPVRAHFGRSSVIARGAVKGKMGGNGKAIALDVVEHGRLEDMLRLGVKGRNPTMSGAISFRAKLLIPPGDVDISKKMKLAGAFTAESAHFSNTDIQDKVNKLSHRGQGDPKAPPDDTVASDFAGQFKLGNGVASFEKLSFTVPGVRVALQGSYDLADQSMDFHGTAKLDAKLSQTTTGFKSFLLKAADPFFKKKDAGAELPVKITGSRDKPSFGLEFHRHKNSEPAATGGTNVSSIHQR
ncbi:MAG TPA: AsmA-like C-terminal region-containing protein [Bryobacteraceae bacterium]|nr:AsmA-like C-terminal region-containing protein [Bryobacteraceae bacterium]